MKKLLTGLLLVNLSLFTASVSAENGCLAQFDKVTTNEAGIDGNKPYVCIRSYKKQHNNICSPLFVYNGKSGTGFGCQLDKSLINEMCTDEKGEKKVGYNMAFDLTEAVLGSFPEDMRKKYKSRLNRTNTVITYKCDTTPKSD